MRQDIGAMLRLGPRLDLAEALAFMRQHGQVVLVGWALRGCPCWECSWTLRRGRYDGVTTNAPIEAVLNCLSGVADALDRQPEEDDDGR